MRVLSSWPVPFLSAALVLTACEPHPLEIAEKNPPVQASVSHSIPMAAGYGAPVLLEVEWAAESYADLVTEDGAIVGWAIGASGNGGVVTWQSWGVKELASGQFGAVTGVSDYGFVGVVYDRGWHAAIWRDFWLEHLSSPYQYEYAAATSINDAGHTVGVVGGSLGRFGALWYKPLIDQPLLLAEHSFHGISNAGTILATNLQTARAVFLSHTSGGFTTLAEMQPLPGDDQTAGEYSHASGTFLISSCCSQGTRRFTERAGVRTVLELPAGATSSSAWAVNESGMVTGDVAFPDGSYAGVVWKNGTAYALEEPAGTMGRASGLNSSGVIVGGIDYYDEQGEYLYTRAAAWYPLFQFSGFLMPVENLPTLNASKAGAAVPIKFSLSGDQGLDILAGTPQSQSIVCDSNAPVDAVEETASAGSAGLSYDAAKDEYTYVWKTAKTWGGSCRQFRLALSDGSTHLANFKFAR